MRGGGDMRSDPGPKPDLKWLSVEKLYVDSRYQRNTKSKASEKNLVNLKQNFLWAYCGALIVCWVASEKKFAVVGTFFSRDNADEGAFSGPVRSGDT